MVKEEKYMSDSFYLKEIVSNRLIANIVVDLVLLNDKGMFNLC